MDDDKKMQPRDDDARQQAQQDIVADPDLAPAPPSDDLDEGELARKDNSGEKAFDALEKPGEAAKNSQGL